MTTDREPLVLSESEHAEMERLMAAAGIASKRELVARAVALFGDVTAGRVPAPPGAAGDLPLSAFLEAKPPDPREVAARIARGGRTAEEVLADLTAERGRK